MIYGPEDYKKLKIRQSLKRRLWCTVLAYDAFSKALETAKHYLEADYHDDHPLHYTFLSSIVVTYGKVFTGANVLQPLPERFTKFDEQSLSNCHDFLITARHNIYAHSDTTFQNYELEIFITAVDQYTINYETRGEAPHITAVSIPGIIALCEYQLARVEAYRQEVLAELLPLEQVAMVLKAERSRTTTIKIRWPRPTDKPNTW